MTSTLNSVPIQRARLQDMDDIEPLNESDHDCLRDIRDVLHRHGKEYRLGVALLHKHFEVGDDEILVEHTDKSRRESIITAVPADDAGNVVETIWALVGDEGEFMLGCRQYCGADVQGNHGSFHQQT